MPVLSGKSHWATISSPNTTYEPVYSIDLALTGAELDKAKNLGLIIKNKGDDRGDFVQIRQKVARRDGSENPAPVVVDANKEQTKVLIGNGSKVNVLYTPYEWSMNGKSGVSPLLKKVQVVDLVSYGEDFDVVQGGYAETEDTMNDEVPF